MDFKETLQYVRSGKSIDASKFGRISDITNAIDFHNNDVERRVKESGENDIHEISKLLVRLQTQKHFFNKPKKV